MVRKDHIGILRWHSPRSPNDIKIWEKMLNRGGKFKVTKGTKVCSNHFAAGYCSDVCPIPTLYLKGYDVETPLKRKAPVDRSHSVPPPKKQKQIYRDGYEEIIQNENDIQTPYVTEHDYDCIYPHVDDTRTAPYMKCYHCRSKDERIIKLENIIASQKKLIFKYENDIIAKSEKKKNCFEIDDISHSDKLVSVYTGLQNVKLFKWIHDRIKDEANNLQYYQQKTKQKLRASRKLDTKSALFLVLVKLRLGLTDNDLAFRFKIAQSTVSTILNTWLPFLSKELSPLIYWPTMEENVGAYPKCFQKFPNTIGIIDCTEGAIEKPSLAKAQAQTYSTYKSKNTWKVLVCITPSGTISFISKTYGGSASDRYITETCGILEKILPGDSIMADKGFNISDLLVGQGSKLVIPPFLKDKSKFSRKNAQKTSNIAKARIHVERAISRIKDYRILQGAIPLTRKDKLDDILIICAALTNLAPNLVSL